MRSKTPLVLMEQLVMVLVFAMAAAICLQVFGLSDRLSKENEARAEAALLAQNTAEELKSSYGEVLLDWEEVDGIYYMEEEGYRVQVQTAETEISGLQKVKLQVWQEEEVLFEIPVAWQEVKGDA
ncbi:MAG: hypothetical protein IJ969_02705 [Anaerotignum sp.]|nr:hypothetical protein [Anaerotignum sp.]